MSNGSNKDLAKSRMELLLGVCFFAEALQLVFDEVDLPGASVVSN